jgi:iron complex outermembrane receptor protein
VDADFNMQLRPWGRHTILFGAGARVSPSTVTQVVPSLNFVPNDSTYSLSSGFVEDDIALLPRRLTLSIGTKLETNTYTGVEVLPSARILWTPGARQSIWAGVTRSARTPSRFERDLRFSVLASAAVPIYAAINGGDQFGSERLDGVEGGYRKVITTNLYIDVAAFTNRYGGLAGLGEAVVSIETVPTPHVQVTLPFVNSVDATSRGVEITPDWKPLPNWQLKGSYSFLHLTAENRPGFSSTSLGDGYVALAAHHQLRVQSRIDLSRGVEFDQTYRVVSALGERVPAYHTLDVRGGRQITGRVDVSVVGQNLLQAHHQEFDAVPVEIRRSVYLQVGYSR